MCLHLYVKFIRTEGVRFFYLDGDVDSFRETGAVGWDLAMDDQSFSSTSLGASAQVSYTFLPSWGVISPYFRLEYTREFEDSADGLLFRFVHDPDNSTSSTIRIKGDDPDSSYMLYGAGVLAAGTYAAAPVMHMGGGF